ncbi:protein-(glutamine-N5) methyltransferase, release factor-specific [Ammonifex degensii KC4]|uniref:Release factor glutamine methyltransferase n=1 Tax=Ammonifex degensii (strain DSM 10501 / KC4) TaxID=429009 RepID=C9RAD1_AMMDK|nr:peptide chain release factor N(5)-glutamine methyltransferase [Ammonifex degensii]ACX51240.1 protein-(glutamine-N5) methyltransferase, release factor-specific [Ammonifex degensii KC4]
MQVKKLLAAGTRRLLEAGIKEARLEAEVLLAHLTKRDRLFLYGAADLSVPFLTKLRFWELVGRRLAGEPLAYLIGKKEFWGLELEVTPAVLVPRPETELLVETGLEKVKGKGSPILVDVGTGSGAVAVSWAVSLPQARLLALDISPEALACAQRNARRHGVEERITFMAGDLLSPLKETPVAGKVDVVGANLPYIPRAFLPALSREVRREPRQALDGGTDGLAFYRRLVLQAKQVLRPGGYLLCEIAPWQRSGALELFDEDWDELEVKRDLAGRARLVLARLRSKRA